MGVLPGSTTQSLALQSSGTNNPFQVETSWCGHFFQIFKTTCHFHFLQPYNKIRDNASFSSATTTHSDTLVPKHRQGQSEKKKLQAISLKNIVEKNPKQNCSELNLKVQQEILYHDQAEFILWTLGLFHFRNPKKMSTIT